jgi:hypothetical protein
MGGMTSTANGTFDVTMQPGLQQFGAMQGGSQTLHYEVVPGSGTGQLTGITGTLHLDINEDGTHHYELHYDL